MSSVPPEGQSPVGDPIPQGDPQWAAEPGFGAVPPPLPPQPPDWGAPAPVPGVRYDVPQDQKNLAMLSTLGIIIVNVLSPLIVFIITNGDPTKRFANDHAKEGLNFCIAGFVAGIVTFLLCLILIGFLLIPLLFGWMIWVLIAGTIQANNGEAPHYPLVPKILK